MNKQATPGSSEFRTSTIDFDFMVGLAFDPLRQLLDLLLGDGVEDVNKLAAAANALALYAENEILRHSEAVVRHIGEIWFVEEPSGGAGHAMQDTIVDVELRRSKLTS